MRRIAALDPAGGFSALYLASRRSQRRGSPITSDPLTGDEWRSVRRSLLAGLSLRILLREEEEKRVTEWAVG